MSLRLSDHCLCVLVVFQLLHYDTVVRNYRLNWDKWQNFFGLEIVGFGPLKALSVEFLICLRRSIYCLVVLLDVQGCHSDVGNVVVPNCIVEGLDLRLGNHFLRLPLDVLRYFNLQF